MLSPFARCSKYVGDYFCSIFVAKESFHSSCGQNNVVFIYFIPSKQDTSRNYLLPYICEVIEHRVTISPFYLL